MMAAMPPRLRGGGGARSTVGAIRMDSPPVDYATPSPPGGGRGWLHPLRLILTLAALALWVLSLFLPVFAEEGSSCVPGRAIVGYDMLLFSVSLSFVFVGMPWLFLNMAMLFVSAINLAGVTGCASRGAGCVTLAVTALCTGVLAAAHALGFIRTDMLQVGIVPWTAALVLAGGAAVLPAEAVDVG